MKNILVTLFACITWVAATTWAVSDRNHDVNTNQSNISALTDSVKDLSVTVSEEHDRGIRSEVRQEAILETLKEIKEELSKH